MLAGYSSFQHQKVVNGTPFFCAYGKDYAYTAEGLMPSHAVTYNFFNQPTLIKEGDVSTAPDNHQLAIDYGSNQQRISAIKHKNGNLETKHYYCNKYFDYEIDYTVDTARVRRHYHYIYGDNGVVAMNITTYTGMDSIIIAEALNDSVMAHLNNYRVTTTHNMYYIHTDHLGSYCAITDANKKVRQHNFFNAWGNHIFIADTSGRGIQPNPQPSLNFTLTQRGFTGHEHYTYFKIINMNGRLYDPVIGRFFSPDKYVANSSFTQDFNRYTYARNCPLMYTDPDGELLWFVPIIIGAAVAATSYTISAAVAPGGLKENWNAGQFFLNMGIGAISGAMTAGIGSAFGAVGSMGIAGELGRAGAHALTQGILSKATGGTFWQGTLAGGFSSIAGSAFMMYGGSFANSAFGTYAFSAEAGGVGSKIAGGKFWQGAVTGLMNAGLNHLAQTVARPSFEDLLANFPTDGQGGEMPAGDVYELIGGKVLSEHQRDPKAYSNACALRVSRALNGSGVDLPNIPGKTLKGADGRFYFYRASDLYNWMTQSYGNPNVSTNDYLSLSGNKGVYIMQANRPADFGAWGHATLYSRSLRFKFST